mgnify:CR=1 FL=1
MKKIEFNSLVNNHVGRNFLIVCPGKNILEWKEKIDNFICKYYPITIGLNKILSVLVPYYHLFTNNDKYENYGNLIDKTSILMLGSDILDKWIQKHNPREYISVKYNDRNPEEPIGFSNGLISGYYRTSGNLAIMVAHVMGAKTIYIAGMSGFLYNFDGDVHYYKAEINRDKKSKEEWNNRYDKPISQSLDKLKSFGVDFKIITPTIYEKHFDKNILDC